MDSDKINTSETQQKDTDSKNNSKINKKIKDIIVILLEIGLVAGIILTILIAIQNSLHGNSPISFFTGEEETTTVSATSTKQQKGTGTYYIEVNINKSAVIIYDYDKKKDEKQALKVFPAAIGKEVKKGKYEIGDKYAWMSSGHNNWNKYNSYFTNRTCLQSVNFREKYSWTMYGSSYKSLGGTEKVEGANIKLSVSAAKWIYNNCGTGTVVDIKKGSKEDKLPMDKEKLKEAYSSCGWDPTDGDKKNPYKSVANGTISAYSGTIYVERGNEPNYLFNVIALDNDGNNITKKIKYDTFDYNTLGTYEVKYSYNKNGLKMSAKVKYKVIDTTPPVVSVPERLTLQIESLSHDKMKTEEVKAKMENLARANASANEGTITAYAFPIEQIVEGDNYVRVVAVDESGNVGSAQTIVHIEAIQKEANERYDPNSHKANGGMSMGETETTKKKKKPAKKENTTTKPQETKVEETTQIQEEETEKTTEEPTVGPDDSNTESDGE